MRYPLIHKFSLLHTQTSFQVLDSYHPSISLHFAFIDSISPDISLPIPKYHPCHIFVLSFAHIIACFSLPRSATNTSCLPALVFWASLPRALTHTNQRLHSTVRDIFHRYLLHPVSFDHFFVFSHCRRVTSRFRQTVYHSYHYPWSQTLFAAADLLTFL